MLPDELIPLQGVVYTETIVHSAPPRYATDVPYQLAIIDTSDSRRLTVRIITSAENEWAKIGDAVELVEERDGVLFFRLSKGQPLAPEITEGEPLI